MARRPADLCVRAFAKINLTLEVLGRRSDGYHELRTIFQSLALHDTLTIRRERGPFRLECGDPDVPTDRSNLIVKAVRAAWRASGHRGSPRDIVIALAKTIPVAAGLGGGSSDAAAALRGLARMWQIDQARLPALAASIGADVPYFLEGGTVLGLERGDLLFPLLDAPAAWVTLVVPPFGVSTKDAYGWFDRDKSGPRSRNHLQGPVAKRHPEIARVVRALSREGASTAAMTGSGSAVYGMFDRRRTAFDAALAVAAMSSRTGRGWRTLVTRTLTRAEYHALAGK
jgi:4-diphosphocytidyl-2-C-methyl-D-erythritol kinase